MEYADKLWILEVKKERGQPPPDWATEKPELDDYETFFASAFGELNTTRRFGGGPIPWSEIQFFIGAVGLDPGNARVLLVLIRAMDETYLEFQAKQRKNG